MWQLYLACFFGGFLGANGIPHFVKGTMGQKHMTPFGRPSSAVVNVIWGWVNFVVAVGLVALVRAHVREHPVRAYGTIAIGALVAALVLAWASAKHPEYNK